MTNMKTVTLIDKLIEKTKNRTIYWKKYSTSNIKLKPLPQSPLDNSLSAVSSSILSEQLNPKDSYICSYNGGIFALLLYNDLFGNTLYLRIQTESSVNSKNYASTTSENDVNDIAKLKRLYNLVDSLSASMEIDDFVDEFLKNE